ncbi:hypothetical protein NDU88_001167 [Pleurodeles waltl]|uniref:Uncharacterized protein n=1 Tax=Pleurodeles waltl TaxID=8319 RepID=A0AAV7P336_PLEWA|nr:hypothetical protein NDU88_001167 [Pleurodeles waltl]
MLVSGGAAVYVCLSGLPCSDSEPRSSNYNRKSLPPQQSGKKCLPGDSSRFCTRDNLSPQTGAREPAESTDPDSPLLSPKPLTDISSTTLRTQRLLGASSARGAWTKDPGGSFHSAVYSGPVELRWWSLEGAAVRRRALRSLDGHWYSRLLDSPVKSRGQSSAGQYISLVHGWSAWADGPSGA